MSTSLPIPEKQSILDAILHLFARYREMRPLFFAAARPMKVEWKMSPYFGVLPLVFRALLEYSVNSLGSEDLAQLSKFPLSPHTLTPGLAGLSTSTHANPVPKGREGRHPMSLTWKLGPFLLGPGNHSDTRTGHHPHSRGLYRSGSPGQPSL